MPSLGVSASRNLARGLVQSCVTALYSTNRYHAFVHSNQPCLSPLKNIPEIPWEAQWCQHGPWQSKHPLVSLLYTHCYAPTVLAADARARSERVSETPRMAFPERI